MAVTLRFQPTGAVPGDGRPVRMRGASLTIGRGPDNDLVLPDPDRVISKTHCVIEDHGGSIVVLDLSTNGTFLNYGKVPLGPTPTPLGHGDVLMLGGYELVVEIANPEAGIPPDPLADRPASHGDARAARGSGSLLDDIAADGDFLDDLLGEGKAPRGPARWAEPKDRLDGLLPPFSGEDLLAPPAAPSGPTLPDHGPATSDAFAPGRPSAPAIPDDWDDLLAPAPAPAERPSTVGPRTAQAAVMPRAAVPAADDLDDLPGPATAQTVRPSPATAARREPAPPAPLPPAPAAAPAPEARSPAPGAPGPAPADDRAARAFLDALGAGDLAIPDDDLEATMTRLGATMRVMIEGLREVLMTRSAIKGEFRIEQTRIGAGGNNPLKFSVSPEQAVEAMVRPRSRGYLPAEEAAAQALDDIRAHEVAMVTGMEAALRGILRRLDPAELAGRIEDRGGLGRLLKGRKALYWETYERMYAEIADQATNDFHEIFSREFAEAYRAQLARLTSKT